MDARVRAVLRRAHRSGGRRPVLAGHVGFARLTGRRELFPRFPICTPRRGLEPAPIAFVSHLAAHEPLATCGVKLGFTLSHRDPDVELSVSMSPMPRRTRGRRKGRVRSRPGSVHSAVVSAIGTWRWYERRQLRDEGCDYRHEWSRDDATSSHCRDASAPRSYRRCSCPSCWRQADATARSCAVILRSGWAE